MTCFRPDGHLTDAALTALVRGDCLEELDRLEPPHSPLQCLPLLLQLGHIMLRCRHLLLNSLQPLRRRPVLW